MYDQVAKFCFFNALLAILVKKILQQIMFLFVYCLTGFRQSFLKVGTGRYLKTHTFMAVNFGL